MRARTWWLVGLTVALLIAGVASFYASNHPDGLSYVADKTGFASQQQESPAADSPLAGYHTQGVDDERLSGGIAGVAGTLLVLGLGGGLFWLLRRRGRPEEPAVTGADRAAPRQP